MTQLDVAMFAAARKLLRWFGTYGDAFDGDALDGDALESDGNHQAVM